MIGNHCKWGERDSEFIAVYTYNVKHPHTYPAVAAEAYSIRLRCTINLDGMLVKKRAQILLDFVKFTK